MKVLFIQAEIEIGDGLPDIRLTRQCLEALKQAGFEVNFYFSPPPSLFLFNSRWNMTSVELIIFILSSRSYGRKILLLTPRSLGICL